MLKYVVYFGVNKFIVKLGTCTSSSVILPNFSSENRKLSCLTVRKQR